MDLATTERQRRIVAMILSRQQVGRPLIGPPGIPEDRKQALRAAFDCHACRPRIHRRSDDAQPFEVNPVKGAEIDKMLATLYATPPEIIAEVKAIIGEGAKYRRLRGRAMPAALASAMGRVSGQPIGGGEHSAEAMKAS